MDILHLFISLVSCAILCVIIKKYLDDGLEKSEVLCAGRFKDDEKEIGEMSAFSFCKEIDKTTNIEQHMVLAFNNDDVDIADVELALHNNDMGKEHMVLAFNNDDIDIDNVELLLYYETKKSKDREDGKK